MSVLVGALAIVFEAHNFYHAALNADRSSQQKAVRLSVRPSVRLSVCQTRAL